MAGLRSAYLGAKEPLEGTTVVMSSTESSERHIRESVLRAIDVRHTEPDDFFQLHINFNDSYSRSIHPTNNCHDFVIEFPQGSSDSMQHRIAQCNHYQVVSL